MAKPERMLTVHMFSQVHSENLGNIAMEKTSKITFKQISKHGDIEEEIDPLH